MMYLITYNKTGFLKNYEPLYNAIKELGNWWHHLDSVWIVRCPYTVDQIQQHLTKHTNKGDLLLIVQIEARYNGILPKEAWDWLQQQFLEDKGMPFRY